MDLLNDFRLSIFAKLGIFAIIGVFLADFLHNQVDVLYFYFAVFLMFFLLILNRRLNAFFLFSVAGISFFFWHLKTLNDLVHLPDDLSNSLPKAVFLTGVLDVHSQKKPGMALLRDVKFCQNLNQSFAKQKNIPSNVLVYFIYGSKPTYSSRVKLWGTLKKTERPISPLFHDQRKFLRRKNISYIILVPEGGIIESKQSLLSTYFNKSQQARNWVREKINSHFDFFTELSPKIQESYKVVTAMLLGDVSELDEGIKEQFRESGSFHLFAVSGLHIGILMTIVFFIFRLLGFSYRNTLILSAIFIWLYVLITGGSPSSFRAALMASILIFGELICRRNILLNSLGLALLILLIIDTNLLFTASFQLTFGVLLAIVIILPSLYKILSKKLSPDPFIPKQLIPAYKLSLFKITQKIAVVILVSFSAWLGSSPLVWTYFGKIYTNSVWINSILAPLAFLILLFAFLSLMSAFFSLSSATLAFNSLNIPLLALAALISSRLAFFPNFEKQNQNFPTRMIEINQNLRKNSTGKPRIILLPANERTAIYAIIMPNNDTWLIDCGNETHADYLIKYFIKPLKLNPKGIILTYFHNEVNGGIKNITKQFPQIRIFANSITKKKFRNTKIYSNIKLVKAGDTIKFNNKAKMKILTPLADRINRSNIDNAISATLSLQNKNISFIADNHFITYDKIAEDNSKSQALISTDSCKNTGDDFIPILTSTKPNYLIMLNKCQKISQKFRNFIGKEKNLFNLSSEGALLINIIADKLHMQKLESKI